MITMAVLQLLGFVGLGFYLGRLHAYEEMDQPPTLTDRVGLLCAALTVLLTFATHWRELP